MEQISAKLTVLFEEPFWVGIYEREHRGKYEACKITFGAEPKDYEVHEFLLRNFGRLRFSPPVKSSAAGEKHANPKRMQRAVARQLRNTGIGTKAQQALSLQREQGKLARKVRSRAQREADQEHRFQLRMEKRRAKHKGR